MTIKLKLTMSHLSMVLVPVVILGGALGALVSAKIGELDRLARVEGIQTLSGNAGDAITASVLERLDSIVTTKCADVRAYFTRCRADLTLLASSDNVKGSCEAFIEYRKDMATKDADPLNVGNDVYKEIWDGEHAFLKTYIDTYGYDDALLIHQDSGQVMFSVKKDPDLGTNLGTGPHKDSNLARAWRRVAEKNEFAFQDFATYAPAGGGQVAFVGFPMKSKKGTPAMVALRIAGAHMSELAADVIGLGKTGEIAFVAAAGGRTLLRSDARTMDKEPRALGGDITDAAPEYCHHALKSADAKGNGKFTDRAGAEVLASYQAFDVLGASWAAVARIDCREALVLQKSMQQKADEIAATMETARTSAIGSMAKTVTALVIVFVVLGILITAMITRGITRTINPAVRVAQAMARGDMTQRVSVRSADELGKLGTSLDDSLAELAGLLKVVKEDAGSLTNAATQLSGVSTALLEGARAVADRSRSVTATTEQVSSSISTMASAAAAMNTDIQDVSSTAEQMSRNMASVASAVEEMTSTITDVARNAEEGSRIAAEARVKSTAATETMSALGGAAKEIGDVTAVIKRLAGQTNLLALNATIQAASAGAAGKSFAVVANEIKELAHQSSTSAQRIAERIAAVQHNSAEAVTAIDEIASVIAQVADTSARITEAINQQTDAAREISRHVQEATSGVANIATTVAQVAKGAGAMSENAGSAAKGANEVAASMQEVNRAAVNANTGSTQVNTAASGLSAVAQKLQAIVAKFKVE